MARGGSRYGAGRPAWHVKAEHCLRLDVRDLARRKVLAGGIYTWRWTNNHTGEEVGTIGLNTISGDMRLNYAQNGQPINDLVRIVQTACNYGGARPWFMCPRCSRRVGVLYLRSGRFMCRHCGRVVYASQAEDEIGRTWRKQAKLERRLGKHWARPKGMHDATHTRILQSVFACEERRDDALARYLQRAGLHDWF